MHAFLHQLRISLSLHFRNRMALIYGYLFPTIFLIAFWVLYRYDRVPLARHMGELLTVTALGGACFGLPTTMVSERERGVWRRYRLAPVQTGTLLASTIVARYVLLVMAGLLQVALAMLIGMPLPNHPLDLWIAFTFVAFALMGLGLVIATLADNVPAVQALGQCIFLPMLIIGGVAVQLTSLPEWAQHVSAFFPGRYAVEAMQSSVTGAGLGVMRFSLLALLLTGLAGFVAGIRMFRWDAQQRFVESGGKAWVALALAAWAAVGLLAETRGRIGPVAIIAEYTPPAQPDERLLPRSSTSAAPEPEPVPPAPAATPGAASPPEDARPPASPEKPPADPAKPAPNAAAGKPPGPKPPASTPPPAAANAKPPAKPSTTGPPPPLLPEPGSWQQVTPAHIEEVMFERLPSDSGVVSPIARADEPMEAELETELEEVRSRLVAWAPGQVADPVQRVRNLLYVAAVPDVFQIPLERYVPHVVFERLQGDVPKDDLIKILFWVATHPAGGDDSAVDNLRAAGIPVNGPGDMDQTRERVMLYALKLLGRLVGKIPS
jgi:ABC-type transport system involved in cytochrome c biogenesis permease component